MMPCRVVRWRRLGEAAAGQGDALRAALSGEDTGANAGLLLLLRAVDRFHAAHGRFPGTYDGCARLFSAAALGSGSASQAPTMDAAGLHALKD